MTARFRREPSLTIVPCRFGNDANLIGACITYGSQKGRTRG